MIEILAIPFVLLGHVIAHRFGLAGILTLTVTTIILLFSPRFALRTLFGNYVFLFSLGMLVAELGRKGWLASNAKPAKAGLILSIIGLLCARFLLGNGSRWSSLVEGLASATLVALLAFGPRCGLHDLLETRPLRFLGRISYSYYLYHPLTLVLFTSCLFRLNFQSALHASPVVLPMIVALVTVSAAIPLGWASYVLVEKPMIWLGRRF